MTTTKRCPGGSACRCAAVPLPIIEERNVTIQVVRQYRYGGREGPDTVVREWEFDSFSAMMRWEREEGWRYPETFRSTRLERRKVVVGHTYVSACFLEDDFD